MGTGDIYADDIDVDVDDVDDADDAGIMSVAIEIMYSWIWKRAGGFHSSKKIWSSGWITMKFGRRCISADTSRGTDTMAAANAAAPLLEKFGNISQVFLH